VAARGSHSPPPLAAREEKITGEICNGFLPSSLSSPAVTTIVTCNKKKEKRRQLILNHFFFFKYVLGLPLF